MSGLRQELGLAQGIGLLSTSLLGTGVFAVPALAALVAGNNSLWAWPVLIVLVFPVAIVFAILGRHFPSAGGVAHFVFVLLLHDRLPDVLKLGQEKAGGLGIAAGCSGLYPGILIHAGADAFVNGPVFKWQVVVVFIVGIEMF